jgi:hypothetical protein
MTDTPINPDLPFDFFDCDRADLTPEHRAWWGRVFIRETATDQFSGGAVFAVYRLDQAEGIGPTQHGVFIDKAKAVACARGIGNATPCMVFF